MRILLVDAFDSFSHIIYQYLAALGHRVEVVRSHRLSPEQVRDHPADRIVLGPGPGHPLDSGHVEIVRAVAGLKPVFGVCLGLQAIAAAHGAAIRPAARVLHGKTSRIRHDGAGCYTGLDQDFPATRYHSLVVDPTTVTAPLVVTAWSDDGHVMGVRVPDAALEAVQFHPESVLTTNGLLMFENALTAAPSPPPVGADRHPPGRR